MKNTTLLFTAIAVVFSVSSFAQRGGDIQASADLATPELMSETGSSDDLVVVSYHVEETVNAKFGGHTTTYNVSDLSLVKTYDLGPNNTRVITPIYGKPKVKPANPTVASVPMKMAGATTMNAVPTASVDFAAPAIMPVEAKAAEPEKKAGYANIDIIKTYERILEKGYKSIDMLKRVANSRFFDGDLEIAAKWYTTLFSMTNDLEPVYYYRFAQSLKSVKQIEKSNEMMAIFERRTL